MSEDYWYPFYPTRYQRDTMHLTAEQDGVYRRLIDHYMLTKQPLPDNNTALSRIAGVDATSNAISMLRAFFEDKGDGFLYHKTCEKLLKEQSSRKMLSKKRAKNAAEKRWGKQKDNATSMPEAMLNDATYTKTYTNTKKEKDIYASDFEILWQKYPKQRAGAKDKAFLAYKSAIKRSTPEEILNGLEAYIGSDEVAKGFAKGAAAWLNDDRWKNDYTRKTTTAKPEPRYNETKTNLVKF